jgi:hypothetical protein
MIRFLRRLPVAAGTIAAGGVLVAFAGGSVVVLALLWQSMAPWLLPGGVVLSLGAGLTAAGVTKYVVLRRPEWTHRAALGSKCDSYLHTLQSLLSQENKDQTVTWISEKTGWSEFDIVHSLALLIMRNAVSEFYDADRRDHYYVATTAFLPRDIDSRLRTLNN